MVKKQYNYYRDQLLTFEDGEVEWKTLGVVGFGAIVGSLRSQIAAGFVQSLQLHRYLCQSRAKVPVLAGCKQLTFGIRGSSQSVQSLNFSKNQIFSKFSENLIDFD
jgi:hypothetical protein